MQTLIMASLLISTVAFGQEPPVDENGDPGRVAFHVINDTHRYGDGGASVSHVQAKGKLPVELTLRDSRPEANRQLQVVIAIYERNLAFPHRFKPGRLVKVYNDGETRVGLTPEPLRLNYSQKIELPPGEYIYYVMLCNPKLRQPKPAVDDVPPLNLDNLPGMILRARVCTATVE